MIADFNFDNNMGAIQSAVDTCNPAIEDCAMYQERTQEQQTADLIALIGYMSMDFVLFVIPLAVYYGWGTGIGA